MSSPSAFFSRSSFFLTTILVSQFVLASPVKHDVVCEGAQTDVNITSMALFISFPENGDPQPLPPEYVKAQKLAQEIMTNSQFSFEGSVSYDDALITQEDDNYKVFSGTFSGETKFAVGNVTLANKFKSLPISVSQSKKSHYTLLQWHDFKTVDQAGVNYPSSIPVAVGFNINPSGELRQGWFEDNVRASSSYPIGLRISPKCHLK